MNWLLLLMYWVILVEQIDEMLSGSRKIGSLLELRKNATYRGKFNDHHPVIEWFWVWQNILFDHLVMFMAF